MASATLTTGNTHLIAEDIFNEPTRERLDAGGNKWVRFLDQQGEFQKSLIAIVNNSPTLRRIIADKTNMVVGDGFIAYKGSDTNLLVNDQKPEKLTGPTLTILEEQLSRVNAHDQTLADVLSCLAFDYDAFGNAFCEVVRGADFCYLYHVPGYMVGLGKAGPDMVIREAGLYDNWEEVPLTDDGKQYEPKGFRTVPIYPAFSEKDEFGVERSLIHVKQYAPGYFYFGLPEWIGAKMWAEIEYRIQRFNTSKFENGFMPSGVLQFFGAMSQQEARAMLKGIKDKLTGTGNNHEIFMQVLRDEKLKANWVPMTNMVDGEFMQLQQLAADAIVSANRWSKSLAGFTTSGSLGTNQQVRQELEYLQNTVIKQRQNLFLNRVINPYLERLSEVIQGGNAIKGVSLAISNSLPVSFMGEISVENALTTDEKREVLGYEPIEQPAQTAIDGATNPTQ